MPLLILMVPMQMQHLSGMIETAQCYIHNAQQTSLYSFRPYHGLGVDSSPSENEYQEHLLGVKAAGA